MKIDLKEMADFLIKNENQFINDEMFGIIFPVVCNKLNILGDFDEIFDVFLNWWNKQSDFRIISSDIEITNKFIEYHNGIYQLIRVRNETIKKWIEDGSLNEDGSVTDGYNGQVDFMEYLKKYY